MLSLVMSLLVVTKAAAQTYPVIWSDLVNTSVTAGNTLTKTSGVANTWDGGAGSCNLLAANTNGFIQFTYAANTGQYMLGLATVNGDPGFTALDYAIYMVSSGINIYEKGVSRGAFGSAIVGDVLRISREGLTVKYYKNGVVFRTSTITPVDAALELRPDVSIHTATLIVPAPVVSFTTRLFTLRPQYTFPSLTNNNGGITIVPEGGNAPYTYIWSSGEATASIAAKPRGSYTVTVTDAASRVATATYYLGYPAAWTNLDNASINADGSIARSAAIPQGTWTSGASSLNLIPPNTDGFIEFAITDITPSAIVGLSDFDPDANYTTIDFGIYASNNGILYTHRSGTATAFGTFKKGDVFRVARVGAAINFSRNGTQFSTTAVNAAVPLLIDLSIPYSYGPSPVVSSSFDKQIRFKPMLTFPNNTNTNGSIALSVSGTYTPATIAWTPGGETSFLITGKSRGSYSATVNDAVPRSLSRTYRLGYPIIWTDFQGTQLNGDNTVSQLNGATGWAAGASSGNILPPNTDGWIEFVVPRGGINAMIGLARMNSSSGFTTIDNAFYLLAGNTLNIYELGANRGVFGYLVEGDVLTLAREGSNIKYYLNGIVVRTIATTPSFALMADISFNGAMIPSPVITSSFTRTPQTFYSIANGNWNNPTTWSLTEGGVAASVYPVPGDITNIKGFNVTVNTGIYATNVNVIANNDNTCLKVDSPIGIFNVKGQINIQGVSNASTIKALQVQNDGKINITP